VPETGTPYRQDSDSTKTEQEEREKKPARSLDSKSSDENKRQLALVKDVTKRINRYARFSKKSAGEIELALSEVQPTDEELKAVIPPMVELMVDDRDLKNAGSTIGENLASDVRTHRTRIEQANQEAKRQADYAAFNEAQARKRQAEIAQRLAAIEAEESLQSANPF